MSISELISRRRALSLVRLAALAAPVAVLTASDVEAQTSGMERRKERRTGRQERRGAPDARSGVRSVVMSEPAPVRNI